MVNFRHYCQFYHSTNLLKKSMSIYSSFLVSLFLVCLYWFLTKIFPLNLSLCRSMSNISKKTQKYSKNNYVCVISKTMNAIKREASDGADLFIQGKTMLNVLLNRHKLSCIKFWFFLFCSNRFFRWSLFIC